MADDLVKEVREITRFRSDGDARLMRLLVDEVKRLHAQLASAEKALHAFMEAYGSQDSHTQGLDDALALARIALNLDEEKMVSYFGPDVSVVDGHVVEAGEPPPPFKLDEQQLLQEANAGLPPGWQAVWIDTGDDDPVREHGIRYLGGGLMVVQRPTKPVAYVVKPDGDK